MSVISILKKAVFATARGPRLWLEGGYLLKAGFTGGTSYTITASNGTIELKADPTGARAVTDSKRNGRARPIIDLNSKDALPIDGIKPDDVLRVVIADGKITIETMHTQQELTERTERAAAAIAAGTASMVTFCADTGIAGTPDHEAEPAKLISLHKSAPRADVLAVSTSLKADLGVFQIMALTKSVRPAVVAIDDAPAASNQSAAALKEQAAVRAAMGSAFTSMGYTVAHTNDNLQLWTTGNVDALALATIAAIPANTVNLTKELTTELDNKARARAARTANTIATGAPLRHVGLFHGVGVLDSAIHTGLTAAGQDAVLAAAVELDESYMSASLTNNAALWSAESRQFALNSPVQDVNLANGGIACDLLAGGIPCTGASLAGRSKNGLASAEEHSSAGALFIDYLLWVLVCNPTIAIIENVVPYAKTASMSVIRSTLKWLGYDLAERIMNGNDFGALESRDRLAVVASTPMNGVTFNQSSMNAVTSLLVKPDTIATVIDESITPDDTRWKPYTYLKDKQVRDIAAGKGFRLQWLTADAPSVGTIGRGYNKARSTEPFLRHPTNPDLARLFTSTEHAALKGIPAHMVDGMSETEAHEVLGQSIIFNKFASLAAAIGRWLAEVTITTRQAALAA